ncbi:hypothetical protein M434DRAFT_28049 [Hypoxylon sp. CO27-5]|nr:hypothetical protein M434DRAFT_28049 [Hypoxylon sp. CO27-5]
MHSTTLAGTDDTADTFSPIAIAIDSTAAGSTDQIIGDWNRDPSWLWPPPPYQPYCKLHFLKECSLYHLHENESFKHVIEKRTPKTKSSKWPAKPTRVQPARRAREKNWKDHSGASTSRQTSSLAQGGESDEFSVALETRREQFQLQLPWPVYKTRLESRIKQISEELDRDQQNSSRLSALPTCVNRGFLECRYCRFNPEVIDYEGSAPRRLVPPAPMHSIQEDHVREEQIGDFGGLKFAVDVVGEHETVILLGMKKLSDFVGRETVGPAQEELAEKLESTRTLRSKKRKISDSISEKGETATRPARKKRRRDDSVG